jgi:hypothetical protein
MNLSESLPASDLALTDLDRSDPPPSSPSWLRVRTFGSASFSRIRFGFKAVSEFGCPANGSRFSFFDYQF